MAICYTSKNCILRGFFLYSKEYFFSYMTTSATKSCHKCWLRRYMISHHWILIPLLRTENTTLVVYIGSQWTRDAILDLGNICSTKVWLHRVSSLLYAFTEWCIFSVLCHGKYWACYLQFSTSKARLVLNHPHTALLDQPDSSQRAFQHLLY